MLIPLLLLVLSTLQIAEGVYARATTSFHSQATLYDRALFDSDSGAAGATADNEVISATDKSVSEFGLPGGGVFLVGEEKHQLPSVTPLLPGGDSFRTHSIVISENP